MNDQPAKAWQPLTFGGVAQYGRNWVGRLFFSCLIVSILTASAVVWTVSRAWFPVIEEAVTHLPPGTEIRGGKLTGPQASRLAENLFLSIRIDPVGEPAPPSLSDIQIVLTPMEIRLRSIFGVAAFPYKPEWGVPLNRADWEPKWAAWRPAVMAYLFFGTIIVLFTSWLTLGIVYAVPVRILAVALRRSISLWGAWKLSVAALLPAAILMTAAIVIYGLGQIRVAELLLAWALHFAIGLIFVMGATFRLLRVEKTRNPFKPGSVAENEFDEEEEKKERAQKNPFRSRSAKKRR
jgi:hypothetical protein